MSTIKDPREIGAPEPQDFQAAYILTILSKECHANDLTEARLRAFDRSGEPPQFTKSAAQRPLSDHRTTPKIPTKRIYPSPKSDNDPDATESDGEPQLRDVRTPRPRTRLQEPSPVSGSARKRAAAAAAAKPSSLPRVKLRFRVPANDTDGTVQSTRPSQQ
ncbi:hypothetical protein B0A49_12707, partial [Cryomyces minteri]